MRIGKFIREGFVPDESAPAPGTFIDTRNVEELDKLNKETNQAVLSMSITTDPNDPGLRKIENGGMQEKYLVLSEEERAKGFVMPVYRSYRHMKCGTDTTIGRAIAETYARNPKFYGGTYCCHCGTHFQLIIDDVPQFYWIDEWEGSRVVPVGSGPDELLAWKEKKQREEADRVKGAGI